MTDASNWRTSSYSGTENCIQVRGGKAENIYVRDTKDRFGAFLSFPPVSWAEFVESVKRL